MDRDQIDLTDSSSFHAIRRALGPAQWDVVVRAASMRDSPDDALSALSGAPGIPGHAADLLLLEWTIAVCRMSTVPRTMPALSLNPSLRLLELSWTGLTALLEPGRNDAALRREHERVLLWKAPQDDRVHARPATAEDLLVLKMAAENIAAESVAGEGAVPVGAVDAALARAIQRGILIAPPSRLVRDPAVFPVTTEQDEVFLSTPSFTLQWHITQVCDLHCRHCYDRSERSTLAAPEAIRVLDDLRSFCRDRGVQGAVSFTGGNPLLHPKFLDIYRAAVDRGFSTAILGNPTPAERIREIVRVRIPAFFQVSLEGLREHNDSIRGDGHFDRVLRFLADLKELGVPSMVMLTLTSSNRDQVLPLGRLLRGRTDVFHFNRLALFGEGARLSLPDRTQYRRFLEQYLDESRENPVLGLKDNLFNILRRERGEGLFGGCAGYGCGAAFNFMTLLADGEVHACRKLPSLIGNIREQSLAEIYDSETARRYRLGSRGCDSCRVRVACGGCLASALSHGLDIFTEKDPFCFMQENRIP